MFVFVLNDSQILTSPSLPHAHTCETGWCSSCAHQTSRSNKVDGCLATIRTSTRVIINFSTLCNSPIKSEINHLPSEEFTSRYILMTNHQSLQSSDLFIQFNLSSINSIAILPNIHGLLNHQYHCNIISP